MSISIRNQDGYYDFTAYEALNAVTAAEHSSYRPLVYIASPFAGDMERNITKAQRYCRSAVDRGCIPLAPHLLYPQFMDDNDEKQRKLGLCFALALLEKCDELWVFGDRISSGMTLEISMAQRCGIPIRYYKGEGLTGYGTQDRVRG